MREGVMCKKASEERGRKKIYGQEESKRIQGDKKIVQQDSHKR